jgi:hypothetical protein
VQAEYLFWQWVFQKGNDMKPDSSMTPPKPDDSCDQKLTSPFEASMPSDRNKAARPRQDTRQPYKEPGPQIEISGRAI